ncbi:hypothetical protein BCM02_102486 [Paenibacillus methanolicus]|uniref:Uncharacterized protein n=1 Tax=Paenibacillus methanolicus TaxID=582686 RepID=A0A5S5CEX6_9BACL|nr:hypothetical protein BCM02_102486 [Paenibacillus methanolicus]
MDKHYDVLIEQEAVKLEDIKNKMEDIKRYFLSSSADFTRQWYEQQAKQLVMSNPDAATQMPSEQLRAVKDDVRHLMANSGLHVEAYLNRHSLWWHLAQNDKTYPAYLSKLPEFFSDPFKLVLGKLGAVFSKHQFIQLPEEQYGETYGHESHDFVLIEGTIQYRHAIAYPDQLTHAMQEYGILHEKAKSILQTVERLQLQKKKEQVGELWDSL